MGTIIVLAVLAVVVGLAIRHIRTNKSSCHCEGCSGDCHAHHAQVK